MSHRAPRFVAATLVLLLGALVSGAQADTDGPPATHARPLRVLLVGNSYSRFNDLPQVLDQVAASVPGGPALHADIAFKAGVGLRTHWERGVALRMLREGHYTDVVLQGHSRAVFDWPSEMLDYAARFAREIQARGARPWLFETWARAPESPLYKLGKDARTPLDMQSRIDALYNRAAQRIGARVAPVGDAWLIAVARWPHLRLHRSDDSHPTFRGTYLTACVLYGALTGRSPADIPYRAPGVPAGVAKRLRSVAAEVLGDEAASPSRRLAGTRDAPPHASAP